MPRRKTHIDDYTTGEIEQNVAYLAQIVQRHGHVYLPLFKVLYTELQKRHECDNLMHIASQIAAKNAAHFDAQKDAQFRDSI